MDSWRRSGDFRQRERRAERATQHRAALQRARSAALTHDAIDRFEEVLKIEQDKQNRDVDDLPMDADAGYYGFRSFGNSSFTGISRQDSPDHGLQRAHSDTQVRNLAPIEKDTCMMRPPSPLSYYDYGCLSTRPRSVFAQHKNRKGESTRSNARHTHCGFYFPGPQFKQGPYGFSMLDPCLLAPRVWKTTQDHPPVRQQNDPGEVRPLETADMAVGRNKVNHPVISDIVRTTKAHKERALMSFRSVDKTREEKLLEQARFEKGMYEGKWRDPLLEKQGQLPEEGPEEKHDWLGAEHEEMDSEQQLASRILFGLQRILRDSVGNVTKLFKAENKHGITNVLEPDEFLRGLVRLGVVDDGSLSVDKVVDAMSIIDPNFDGRVNLPVIQRAVKAATKVQGQRTQAAQLDEKARQTKLGASYSESLPVEVVKVDRESRSLFNFERSFEKFRAQQRTLLAFHNEVAAVH